MADNNQQTAPASQADNAATTVENNAAGVADVQESNVSSEASKAPATAPSQSSAFDPQTNYESLKQQYESLGKNYSELRKEFTRRSQAESELKKQIEALTKSVSTATKKEISPEEFISALQTQGIKALDPLKEQWRNEIKEEYDKALAETKESSTRQAYELEVLKRQLDTKNYPDFATLRPIMADIADSENCPINLDQPINVVIDSLYKYARSLNAENSVKQAREMGRKEADLQAAKEAGSAVAAGGKAGSATNPAEIKDLKKLREYFVSQLGEAE